MPAPVLPDKQKPKEKAKPWVTRMFHVSFISFVANARRAPTANAAIRRVTLRNYEEGPKRSNAPAEKRPTNDKIYSFYKKERTRKRRTASSSMLRARHRLRRILTPRVKRDPRKRRRRQRLPR